jgi:hypothetical protein
MIKQQTAGTDFPADSFFDVFVEIQTGGLTLFNKDAIRMETVIYSIPPVGGIYTTPTGCVPLYDKSNPDGPPVLYLSHAKHAIPPDHYLCYKVKAPKFEGTATLTDQFETGSFEIKKPVHLCNPVDKNQTGIQDPDTHMKSYKIKPVTAKHSRRRGIRVQNQFGLIRVDTIREDFLLVPSSKETDPAEPDPTPPDPATLIVDHYKCYKIKAKQRLQVSLEDQFTTPAKTFDLKKPTHLCNPVDKNGEGIKNAFAHLVCYQARPATGQPRHVPVSGVRVANQFGLETLTTIKEDVLCVPSVKNPEDIEIDEFPNSRAEVTINTPQGTETVQLFGPTTVHVNLGEIADTDGDGMEQLQTEMLQLELTGSSPNLGPIMVMLRDVAKHPMQATMGEIEEDSSDTKDTLDVPPFTPTGRASSFFDVFFEIQLPNLQLVLHNHDPKHMETTITNKPPAEDEVYESPDVIELFDENENLVTGVTIGPTSHTPNPRCGNGVVDAGEQCDPPGSHTCPQAQPCQNDCTCPTTSCSFDPQNEICSGACPDTSLRCLFAGGQCQCVSADQSCEQLSPEVCVDAGLCANPAQRCQPGPTNCFCQ